MFLLKRRVSAVKQDIYGTLRSNCVLLSQVDSMDLDVLSALGDTLPKDEPKPEPPKLKPEDIVSVGA